MAALLCGGYSGPGDNWRFFVQKRHKQRGATSYLAGSACEIVPPPSELWCRSC